MSPPRMNFEDSWKIGLELIGAYLIFGVIGGLILFIGHELDGFFGSIISLIGIIFFITGTLGISVKIIADGASWALYHNRETGEIINSSATNNRNTGEIIDSTSTKLVSPISSPIKPLFQTCRHCGTENITENSQCWGCSRELFL
jgi:hypothetical protein